MIIRSFITTLTRPINTCPGLHISGLGLRIKFFMSFIVKLFIVRCYSLLENHMFESINFNHSILQGHGREQLWLMIFPSHLGFTSLQSQTLAQAMVLIGRLYSYHLHTTNNGFLILTIARSTTSYLSFRRPLYLTIPHVSTQITYKIDTWQGSITMSSLTIQSTYSLWKRQHLNSSLMQDHSNNYSLWVMQDTQKPQSFTLSLLTRLWLLATFILQKLPASF